MNVAKFQNGKSVINNEIKPFEMFIEVNQISGSEFEIVARDVMNIFTDEKQIVRNSMEGAMIDARDFSENRPEDF